MANPSKQKGTAWESAVTRWLRLNGYRSAERRALTGTKDRGDIAGVRGLVISCKNVLKFNLEEWVREAKQQALHQDEHDGLEPGTTEYVVFIKRRGRSDPGRCYAVLEIEDYVNLRKRAGG